MKIEIEKNIPIPQMVGKNIYPLNKMEIGDSFKVSQEEGEKLRSAASQYGRRNKKKFSILRFEGGYRCWRVR
jgi:hypothetical protein